MSKQYDVVIIGAGPGGMTAALYASRSNLSVLMLDRGIYGGQMNNTAEIENYPGFKSILGPELGEKMYASSTQFGAEYTYGTVSDVIDHGAYKTVKTDEGDYEAKAVVIATGAEHRHLGVPGEDQYSGMGVSYCAVCDGAFFKDREVAVIGGGDSAVEEGIYLANLASKVTVVHRRDQLRAQKILQHRAFANDKMEFVWNAQVEEIVGDGKKIESVKYRDKETGEEKSLPAEGVFIYVGIEPMTEPFKNLGILNEAGWIETDDTTRTKVPGVFAVGDVRDKHLRQIANAVGEGGLAGQAVFDYLQELGDSEIAATEK
ncbi:thioredoxin-disulfide reductase [Lapidilactobacillus mulanensis]|uniref:Thioredoxin reductase n=1 Tax=Lapidilactobacillus mulanensis TaxID=2485999 RepID=A0ABW4DRP7_9LACO|nr:thioredoxin-disulfide reductase [Lapidilactobacillus mulanensis]